jgi:nitrite reductase/ring-hydroxylating ferredoxin subunit
MSAALCPLAEVTEAGKEVMIENQGRRSYLMLFRKADEVLGYHNVCPHQGRNLNYAPDRFLFDPQGRLVCPHHGAVFEVASGNCVQGPCQGAALRQVALRIEGGQVMLANAQLPGS